MKSTFQIKYNGKSFQNITDVLEIIKAEEIKEVIIENLEQFQSELEQYGGIIDVNIKKQNTIDWNFSEDIPKELRDRIKSSVQIV